MPRKTAYSYGDPIPGALPRLPKVSREFEAKAVAILREERKQRLAFLERLRSLPIDDQTLENLEDNFSQLLGVWTSAMNLSFELSDGIFDWARAVLDQHKTQAEKQRKGPNQRHALVTKRYAEIDKLMAAGMTDAKEIHRHLQDHAPELLRKDRRGGKVSPENMMDGYLRSKRP
jgi:hypothetical protein